MRSETAFLHQRPETGVVQIVDMTSKRSSKQKTFNVYLRIKTVNTVYGLEKIYNNDLQTAYITIKSYKFCQNTFQNM